ncbi:MAG: cyclin-dependent kinase inhibitor 3 family protein [Myxococcota bacterium]
MTVTGAGRYGISGSSFDFDSGYSTPRRSSDFSLRYSDSTRNGGLSAIAPNARTSASDPLRVVFAPSPTTGRLGMTICPGKKGSSIHEYSWQRDLGADLDRLKSAYNTKVLVCLLEDHELVSLGVPNLVAEAEKRGIKVVRFPIPDLSAPKDVAKTKALVKELAAQLEAGDNVVVHCRGGNGRTGLIATCILEELGMTPSQALKGVRSVRPNAVETDIQESFVNNFS